PIWEARMSERPGRSNPRGEHAVGWAAAASDDRSHIGYITHFSLDYKMRLIYRFPILTRGGAQPIPRGCAARRLGRLFDIVRCEDGAPAFVIAGLVTTSRVTPLAWAGPSATGAGIRSCAPAKLANPTKTPKRARAARPGCTRFLFSSCFALLSPASRVAPSGAGVRPFPVFIL